MTIFGPFHFAIIFVYDILSHIALRPHQTLTQSYVRQRTPYVQRRYVGSTNFVMEAVSKLQGTRPLPPSHEKKEEENEI